MGSWSDAAPFVRGGGTTDESGLSTGTVAVKEVEESGRGAELELTAVGKGVAEGVLVATTGDEIGNTVGANVGMPRQVAKFDDWEPQPK